MIIGILIPLIGVAFIIGASLYVKNDSGEGQKKKKKSIKIVNEEDEDDNDNKSVKQSELKKLIEIKDIKNNMVHLKNGGIRVILSISSPDFELLTNEEQDIFEDSLRQFGLSLTSPIQFFTTPTRIETKQPLEAVSAIIDSSDETIPDKLKIYSSKLYGRLQKLESEKGIYVRKSFCVIGVNIPENEKKALNELQNRVDLVASGLSYARMKVNILNSEQCAQLFTDILNKGNNIIINNLVRDGVLELYVEGSGRIIYDENKENNTEESV